MSDTGHTKTPWEACERGDYSDDGIVILGDDLRVAVVNRDDDAAYIVTACNAFPALVEAGNRLISLFDELQSITTAERIITGRSAETLRKESIAAVQDLRAALTSIKGGDVPARVTFEEISE